MWPRTVNSSIIDLKENFHIYKVYCLRMHPPLISPCWCGFPVLEAGLFAGYEVCLQKKYDLGNKPLFEI